MVMIIDDDKDDCDIFRDAASEVTDCKCHCIHDSRIALTLLDKSATLPNCIFLDINMPVLDGFGVLTRIKNNPRLANIPIIMYSTTPNPMEAQRSLELGASRFVRKTADFSRLVQVLREVKADLVDPR